MRTVKKIKRRTAIKKNWIANLTVMLLAACSIRMASAEDLVNLKYLEQEKKPAITYSWDRGEIRIKKGAADIRLYLNYPFLVSGDSVVRLDTPPFTENGDIFIGNYTYEKIAGILESGGDLKSGVRNPAFALASAGKPGSRVKIKSNKNRTQRAVLVNLWC